MDHLSGFQWLLRSRLGRFPACRVYGPPGITEHVACFINSFLWDRIGPNGLAFEVVEVDGRSLNVRKDRLRARGLTPGPWLTELKRLLQAGRRSELRQLPDGSEADVTHARRLGHLTTRAAGEIASEARVTRLLPFHFSRRYRDNPGLLYDELSDACACVARPPSMGVFD